MTNNASSAWKTFVSDLKVGEAVDTVFLLTRLTLREYAKGHFLSVRLCDKTGKISGVAWNDAESIYEKVKEGDLVTVKGKVGKYQDEKQIQIDSLRKVSEPTDMDPSHFLQVSPIPLEQLILDFDTVISTVSDPDYRALLMAFRNHEVYWPQFTQAPGAKLWHHPYLHGLLEHTLSAVKIGRCVGISYKYVDLDLLLTGIIFHDIGKIKEFEYARKFDYTTDGRLLGHIFLGTRIVDTLLQQLPDFPEEKRRLLMHMILSHHGEVERSPIVPMTLEACLLHHIENMDAQMMAFEREMDKVREESQPWTGYVNLIERYLYLGAPAETAGNPGEKKVEASTKPVEHPVETKAQVQAKSAVKAETPVLVPELAPTPTPSQSVAPASAKKSSTETPDKKGKGGSLFEESLF